tara:strand:- start:2574 stop:2897 length:324 start_codon:yes stop_codon:yes gene_type:complete
MIKATKKWLTIKISSGLLIPFMLWFIINSVSLLDANNSQLIEFLSNISNKVIFSLFLLLAFTFFTLTISEVFEDYINDLKTKNVAKRLLVLFSIVIGLLLFIFLIKF